MKLDLDALERLAREHDDEVWVDGETLLVLVTEARIAKELEEAVKHISTQVTPEEYEDQEGEEPGDAAAAEAYEIVVLYARTALTRAQKMREGG